MAISGINSAFTNVVFGTGSFSVVSGAGARQSGAAQAATFRGAEAYSNASLNEVRSQAQGSEFNALRPQHSGCSLCLDA